MGLFSRKSRDRGGIRTYTALTAAAPSRQMGGVGKDKISKKTEGWQAEAWAAYDQIGELKYACLYLSNALSRCRLIASTVGEDGMPTKSCDNEIVRSIVNDIAGSPAAQGALLGKFATHLTVPGECYLVILSRETEDDGIVDEWHVVSTSEVKKERAGKVTVTLPDGTAWELDKNTDSIHRIWIPHARIASEADSAVRAALPTLREMTRLGQWVEATAKSRLVSNGILAVPNEMTTPTYGGPPGATDWNTDDAPGLTPDPLDQFAPLQPQKSGPEALTDALLETMSTAVRDPSSAAALVPIIIEAPGDWIGKIQHIALSSEFTDVVIKLREAATARLALSLNIPAEVLTGMAAANHWSAWQIEESAIKMHIEPLLTTICDRLTELVLHPMLEREGIDPDDYTVWFDTSALTLKPNRADDAIVAFDKGVLSGAALLRELGFGEEDGVTENMSDIEKRQLAVQLVKGAPSLLPLVAHIIGLDVAVVPEANAAPAPTTSPARPADGPPEGGDDGNT